MPSRTVEDYAAAKAVLDALNTKWDSYSGNNPNKFRADIESAKAKVHSIETELKASGILPRTLVEERDAMLDAAFPKANSRNIVEWEGKKYVRRFSPIAKSLSGKTVNEWHKYWEEVRK